MHHHLVPVRNDNKTTDHKINAMINAVTFVKDKAAITITATIKTIVDKMEIRSSVVERMNGHKVVHGEVIGEIMEVEVKVRILYELFCI